MIFVPADLGARDGGPTPAGPKSSLLESEAFRKICPPPLAVLLARVDTSCPVRVPPASGSFVPSATVMSEDPLKATPLMFLEVWSVVAVVEFPARAPEKFAAVSVPAPLRVAAIEVPAYHLNWAVELGTDNQSVLVSVPRP